MNRPEFSSQEMVINDDHLPFLHAGIPAIDLIDLNYPAWHTEGDTMDKVSASSLQAVADVLLAALPDVIARVKIGR
jgi:Peptidase family M28